MRGEPLTILISGMIGATPGQGGAAWSILQYVLGFQRLGHTVYLIEPVEASALQPEAASLADSESAKYFRAVMRDFGLERHGALLLAGTEETIGVPYRDLAAAANRADLLINVAGMLVDQNLMAPPPVRVYLDLDPAFVQLWQAEYGIDMRFAGHTHFVTVGLNVGTSLSPIPTCGLDWHSTLQPVVLDWWPLADEITYDAFTTIANWRGYGSVEYGGQFYGQKAHSLRPLFSLPRVTRETFLLALAIHPAETPDLEALTANGWTLVDPAQVAATPQMYRRFIGGSRAEFGLAKSGYVVSRSGWFSDRSVCYLASGRPVIAQDTGFGSTLPVGEGLFAFSTIDDVIAATEALRADYEHHRRRARALAEEHFSSDRVLRKLMAQVGLA